GQPLVNDLCDRRVLADDDENRWAWIVVFPTSAGPHPRLAVARYRRFAAVHSNLRADFWRRLPAVALAKAGRRFGWQAVTSLRPQALLFPFSPELLPQAGQHRDRCAGPFENRLWFH